MSDFPECPNFVKKRGCERSAIQLKGEGDEHFYFVCATCKLEWVVSKPTAISRSKFRNAEERLRQDALKRRAREQKPIFHT